MNPAIGLNTSRRGIFPSFMIQDSRNTTTIDAKHRAKLTSCNVSGSIQDSYFRNLLPSEFCVRVSFSAWRIASPLLPHIMGIVSRSAKKQVLRVATSSVVAFVQNLKPIRHRSVFDNPGSDVGVDNPFTSSATLDLAIATRGNSSRPIMTRAKLWSVRWDWAICINLGQKTFNKRIRETLRENWILNKVLRHIDSYVVDVLARLQLLLRRAPSFLSQCG